MELKLSQIKSVLGAPYNTLVDLVTRAKVGGVSGKAFDPATTQLYSGALPWFNVYSGTTLGVWNIVSGNLTFILRNPTKMSYFAGYNHNAITPYCETITQVFIPLNTQSVFVDIPINIGSINLTTTTATHLKVKLGNFTSQPYALDSFSPNMETLVRVVLSGIVESASIPLQVVLCDSLGRNEAAFPQALFPTFYQSVYLDMERNTSPVISYAIEMGAEDFNKLWECSVIGNPSETLVVGATSIPSFQLYSVSNPEYGTVSAELILYRNGVRETSVTFNTTSQGNTKTISFYLNTTTKANDQFTLGLNIY